ncbi:MAG: MBOAT family protein [Flavobacteriales bacterium]|nr:MBOAT family protein [Flavobacteriales bacterium]
MVDFYAGLQIGKTPERRKKKWYFLMSLFVNLGFLFYFKYFHFFTENTSLILSRYNIFTDFTYYDILLPVGISFYTFQTLSYTIDVYHGKTEPETHLGYFALYVAYFPQLVAGPIERSYRLLPQLKREPNVITKDVKYAVNKILLGFFKKLVVADTVSQYVDAIYANVDGTTGTQLYWAAFLFPVQLFADFSGYTDIAIGSARLMGVKLMENFKKPLWQENHISYWANWHISLTSWIRDYIFIPLSNYNRSPGALMLWTIFILVLIGVWHGANWTFIVFGVVNGCIIVIQRILRKTSLVKAIRSNSITYQIMKYFNLNLLLLEAVYFRSVDLEMAHKVQWKIITEFNLNFHEILSLYKDEFVSAIGVSLLLWLTVFFKPDLKFKYNWAYVVTMLIIIVLLGQNLENQFIYFQF